MGQAPIKCPMRGKNEKWRLIDTYQKDFSFEKALVGAALIGKVGVLAGFLGEDNKTNANFKYTRIGEKDYKYTFNNSYIINERV